VKVYRIHKADDFAPRVSLAVDGGLRTTGYCLLDFERVSMEAWTEPQDTRGVLGRSFPNLYRRLSERVDLYLTRIPPDTDPAEVEVTTEFTYLRGEFSVGLTALVAVFARVCLREFGVGRVTLVPNRIPQYMLRVPKAANSEIVKYVKEKFPPQRYCRDKRYSAHSADAVLFQGFCYRDWFLNALGVELRPPKVEWVTWKESEFAA